MVDEDSLAYSVIICCVDCPNDEHPLCIASWIELPTWSLVQVPCDRKNILKGGGAKYKADL